jgi:hypothetical protein
MTCSGQHRWNCFPEETLKLICYDGDCPPNHDPALYFLIIKTTRMLMNVDGSVALSRSLNNESQALHNVQESI